jgi:hypothetical protein
LNLAWRHRLSAAASLGLVLSLARRRPPAAAAWLGLLCALNGGFYRLLSRRGRRHLMGGIALHVAHHLVSVLAFLVGVLGMFRLRKTVARTGRE